MVRYVLLILLAALPAAAAQTGFTADNLADGVHLMRAVEGRQDLVNSLVVERKDGLLIVNAQPTTDAALELLKAVSKISSKPVRYLVYSNPQAESVGGATAFPDSTLIIASDACAGLLADPEYDFSREQRLRAGDPEGWKPPERRMPVLTIIAQTDLRDPDNLVRLIPVSPARTGGDLMVQLPGDGILYVGPLLPLDRNPFAADADVGGWNGVLNRIASMSPELVLPARGAAVDTLTVRQRRDSLAWVRGQVEAAFVERINVERIPEWILGLPDAAKYFDLEAEPPFAGGLIERAVEEAIEQRRKRGLWDD